MALKPCLNLAAIGLFALLPTRALHADEGEDLMRKSDCFSCHSASRKIVGPAYMDVAKKYKGASAAKIKVLVQKVKNGGSGNWGAVPMAGHPSLADADIEKMLRWVLSRSAANSVVAAPAAPAAAPVATVAVEAKPASGVAEPKKTKKKAHHSKIHLETEELAYGTDEEVRGLMDKQGCFGCHSGLRGDGDPEEMPWPSFIKIENKYKKSRPMEALVKKVSENSGKLAWGKVPHPQYTGLPPTALRTMLGYILDGKASKASAPAAQVELSAEEWMRKKSDCFTCHSVDKKVVGPAYKEVAKKYAGAGAAQVASLVKKVKQGGSGSWGTVPMAAHASVPDAQIEKSVRWVLEQ
jgi:cytochrome c